MEVTPPLDHGALVLLLLQLGLLLLVARLLGHLAVSLGLPSVVGELLAGIVLGPSLFGAVAPGLFSAIVPADPRQFHLLEIIAFLGVLMLLVITGLETDIDLIVRKGRSAAAISLFGIAVPFSFGFALGQVLPETFIADVDQRLVFSLFLGTALGISAIPVIAKVLIEMNVVRRDIGQLTLAAGMIDDTIGWILLSIVAGLARSGVFDVLSIAQSALSVFVVVGLAFTVGRRVVDWLFRTADERSPGDLAQVSLLTVLMLLMGSLTHFLGIEAVLGAFLVGILAGQVKRFHHSARRVFEIMTLGVFAPIFFAASGLRVDLRALLEPRVFVVGLLVLAVAILGKFLGAALGAKLSGLGRWEALSLGAGMNARGAIEIIVATVGLGLGVLTPEMYTIILLVAIVTSLMAPPILRAALRRVPESDEERRRLELDARRDTSFIAGLHRVLLPTRGGSNSLTAARLLTLAIGHEPGIEVTSMTVVSAADRTTVPAGRGLRMTDGMTEEADAAEEALDAIEANFDHLEPEHRRRLLQAAAGGTVDTILDEARRGYGLLVLGATNTGPRRAGDPLFNTVVDRLVQDAPCPVFVVSHLEEVAREHVADLPLRRILLPTAGTDSGRHCVEIACAIARATGATIEIAHVVEDLPSEEGLFSSPIRSGGKEIGRELLARATEEVHGTGVSVRTHLLTGQRVETAIVDLADKLEVDLIVLSSSLRPVSQRAFFGPRIDYVLGASSCPVLVVS